jgi:phosphoribosyl 1,2-cyclic phosphodiesterase/ActR/RegA family two-component response regulator
MEARVPSPPSCCLVDDDPDLLVLARRILEGAGWQVDTCQSGIGLVERLARNPPDCVILDIMMPGMDGFEVFGELRREPKLDATRIVFLSAKTYEFDRRKAFDLGADGFFAKPIDPGTFPADLQGIVSQRMTLEFWGVHGTLPAPGRDTQGYGGNTSCVSLRLPRDRLFIFDAGTGIRPLGDHLIRRRRDKLRATLFISHAHWDHINALPHFAPLYIPGNEFEICGPAQDGISVQEMVSAQMDNIYFPITVKEFGARVQFRDLREGEYEFDGVEVRTLLLKHPGYCLGYRVQRKQGAFCYVTDNELFPLDSPAHDARYLSKLIEFVRGAEILVTDTTYFDEEYPSKSGWGHSGLGEVCRLAAAAEVKRLCLFHHDPSHTDADIDRKAAIAADRLAALGADTQCLAPAEGQSLQI